jgi:hypothetical protein
LIWAACNPYKCPLRLIKLRIFRTETTTLIKNVFFYKVSTGDLRETGWEGVEWMHLAGDRDQWQALVNGVMNLRAL